MRSQLLQPERSAETYGKVACPIFRGHVEPCGVCRVGLPIFEAHQDLSLQMSLATRLYVYLEGPVV